MNYRKIMLLAAAATLSVGSALAQSSVQARAEREIRQQEINFDYATDAVRKGNECMSLRDYESAYQYYKSAVDATPTGGKMAGRLHKQALDGFSKAVVAFASQRISEGRLEDARMILDVLVNPETGYNKTYKPALQVRQNLNDPTRYHAPALSPKFIANVEEVKLLLLEAQGYYDSGRFDLAIKRYEKVLTIDKYNIAARRGMEMVNKRRTSYEADAYNDLRADALAEVTKGWALPVVQTRAEISNIIDQPVIMPTGVNSINRKLDDIIIPKVEFRQASLRQAVEFLSQQAARYDNTGDGTKGLNIITKIAPGSPEENLRVDLSVNDVPLRAALDFVAQAADMKIKVDPYAVVVVPVNEPTDDLITREYRVPPGFISTASSGGMGGGIAGGLGSGAAGSSGSGIAERSGAREYLESNGVQFPVGATAIFLPSSSRLIVKNTQANLDVIEALIISAQQNVLAQVSIETKFVEISQTNLEEMGFDWFLGNISLPFGSGTRMLPNDGGTRLSGGGPPTIGSSGEVIHPNHMTGGLRSGTRAIGVNGIDSLLFGTPLGAAPAALAFAGVLSGADFQVFLRALSQHKSVDLVSAPHVTTQSGKSATVEVVREFRFPSDYSLPRVMAQRGSSYQPPIPTTPTAFERRDVGVTLEVEPTVDESKTYITMRLAPRVVEFDGFLNYGSPIIVGVRGGLGSTVETWTEEIGGVLFGFIRTLYPTVNSTIVATENVINRPVFTRREVETEVTIVDGQTVVLGGLIREDVQKVQDKVPIIGDIPLVGLAFRTKSEQHIKRNMMIFVTANLVDYGGQPILKTDEGISTADAFLPDVNLLLDPDAIPLPQ